MPTFTRASSGSDFFYGGQLSIFDGKGGVFLLDFLVCVAIKGSNRFLYPFSISTYAHQM